MRAFYPRIIPVLIKSLFVGDSYVFIKTLPVIDPLQLVAISKHFKRGIDCSVLCIAKLERLSLFLNFLLLFFYLLSKNAFENCCFEMIVAISGVIFFFQPNN